MSVERINNLPVERRGELLAPRGAAGSGGAGGAGGASFGEMLLDALKEADRLQDSADAAIQGLAGGGEDVARVMTAVEKADLAFRTLMQVRNKLVDAYEELMRLRI